ncbi:hypothetical protein GQ42DRAFT_131255 [Ramicandelaber brevisporus]|nr:hypothetical protein GQ42DRAFT_131255 [Ramicandelaber brevisporus]
MHHSAQPRSTLDLDEEAADLEFLQSSLQEMDTLTRRSGDMLRALDRRLEDVCNSIDPLNKSSEKLARLNDNVERTLQNISRVIALFDVTSVEEAVVVNGPDENDFGPYLAAIGRLQDASTMMEKLNLKACERTAKHVRQLLKVAAQHLTEAFRRILQQYCEPIDFSEATSVRELPAVPPSARKQLARIMNNLSNSEGTMEAVRIYGQLRSAYIVNSLHPLCRAVSHPDSSGTGLGSGYGNNDNGSSTVANSFMALINGLILAARAESEFVYSIIPKEHASAAFGAAIDPAVTAFAESTEKAVQSRRRTVGYARLDLFDLYETLRGRQRDLTEALQLNVRGRRDIDKLISSISAPLLKNFADFMESLRNTAALPAVSPDANVYELTSRTLQYLQRLAEHREAAETMIANLGDGHWNAGVPTTTESGAPAPGTGHRASRTFAGDSILRRYMNDCIEVLIATLDQRAAIAFSRRPLPTAIFLANNYQYASRAMRSDAQLYDLLHSDGVVRIDNMLNHRAINDVVQAWRSCVVPLNDSRTNIKDKLRTFNQSFDDLVRQQQACVIADPELKDQLLAKLRATVVVSYDMWFEANRVQLGDTSGKGAVKYLKYDRSSLDATIYRMFL